MRIDIQSRGFALTEALRAQADRRLRIALGSVSGHVRQLAIRLADINGPRGGVDKRCTLRAQVEGAPAVVIEHRDADLYVAIDLAASRLRRTVARRLEKTLCRRHVPGRFRPEGAAAGSDR
jgi:ribosome-associated translation inhibitor RaiA